LIAEGERESLEKLASAIDIKDLLIDVHKIESELSEASGAYPTFRKMTGPDEVGERLDDGIEILKELVVGVRAIASNFAELNGKMEQMLDKQDQMLDKQDSTIEEIQKLRSDTKSHVDRRLDRIETHLKAQKEESLP